MTGDGVADCIPPLNGRSSIGIGVDVRAMYQEASLGYCPSFAFPCVATWPPILRLTSLLSP